MGSLLPLVIGVPALGFLFLALWPQRLSKDAVVATGVGAALLAAVLGTAEVALAGDAAQTVPLGRWIAAGGVEMAFDLSLDGLSSALLLVVTWVGALVHVYSAAYMRQQPRFRRYFALLNLFLAAMLLLVLARDLAVLFIGWEGVGVCSFLLIGFHQGRPEAVKAARKAFLVTRVGDAALLGALVVLASELGTLTIPDVLSAAPSALSPGTATAVTALILVGAVAKSAQLPLQTWLPDAMAGPTPVSALIHAATMVTAGVYLVARTLPLFELAPGVQLAVGVIGAVTLLAAGLSAVVQRDIKRVLAWSTISQLGYMFLALGVGSASAAAFHLTTHAAFKALLFLGAGVVIAALGGEHDVLKMGGLRKRMPVTFAAFAAGALALAGLPLVTAGWYSKDAILMAALAADQPLLLVAGIAGAAVTALYAGRLLLLVFFGPLRTPLEPAPSRGLRTAAVVVPLVVLAALALVLGAADDVLPALHGEHPSGPAADAVIWGSVAAVVLGLLAAFGWWRVRLDERLSAGLLQRGWGFDRLYAVAVVRPFRRLTGALAEEPLNAPWRALERALRGLARLLSDTQRGLLRWYAAALAAGAVLLMAAAMAGG